MYTMAQFPVSRGAECFQYGLASNSATVQYLDGSNWSAHFRPTTKPKALQQPTLQQETRSEWKQGNRACTETNGGREKDRCMRLVTSIFNELHNRSLSYRQNHLFVRFCDLAALCLTRYPRNNALM